MDNVTPFAVRSLLLRGYCYFDETMLVVITGSKRFPTARPPPMQPVIQTPSAENANFLKQLEYNKLRTISDQLRFYQVMKDFDTINPIRKQNR